MLAIVTYDQSGKDYEKEFDSLIDATRYADMQIMNGIYASISIYLEPNEEFKGYPLTLATVYIYVDGILQE